MYLHRSAGRVAARQPVGAVMRYRDCPRRVAQWAHLNRAPSSDEARSALRYRQPWVAHFL